MASVISDVPDPTADTSSINFRCAAQCPSIPAGRGQTIWVSLLPRRHAEVAGAAGSHDVIGGKNCNSRNSRSPERWPACHAMGPKAKGARTFTSRDWAGVGRMKLCSLATMRKAKLGPGSANLSKQPATRYSFDTVGKKDGSSEETALAALGIFDPELAIANFLEASSSAASGEGLLLADWRNEDWRDLFRFTAVRGVRAGDALIRHGEPDRTLYFVLRGELEIVVPSGDGLSLGRVAQINAGSVLGELAFFDAGPRSAGAWAVTDCEVAAMSPDQYSAFEQSHAELARHLLFAMGRILALRLRRTNARVTG